MFFDAHRKYLTIFITDKIVLASILPNKKTKIKYNKVC